MSDTAQGPGWWQASDGRYYPPDQHPDPQYRERFASPAPPSPAPPSPPPASPPPQAAPRGPSGPPAGAPPGASSWGPPAGATSAPTWPPGPSGSPPADRPVAWLVALASGVLLVIAAFLPWATIDIGGAEDSTGGLDGDGVLTLVLGLAVLAFAALALTKAASKRKLLAILVLVAAVLALLIALVDIADVDGVADDVAGFADVSVGIGLWLTALAAVAGVAGGVLALLAARSGPATGGPPNPAGAWGTPGDPWGRPAGPPGS